MIRMTNDYDCIIIGGGFYGCSMALFLKKYFDKVLIIEKEHDIMQRASYANQARVHNGYHYPRSLVTAFRSFINFPRFIKDFRHCIKSDFEKIYAIASIGSKVNSNQFFQTFKKIGAPVKKAPANVKKLFNSTLIEDVFIVKEYAFDAVLLKEMLLKKIDENKIDLMLDTEVRKVSQTNDHVEVKLADDRLFTSKFVFNCTYSQINKVLKDSNIELLPLKHEVTEMALVDVPDVIKKMAVTVMDGPFFSIMPFPAEKLHTLSHVRYTPHSSWIDKDEFHDGHEYLQKSAKKSNFLYMVKDSARYMPILSEVKYVKSLFEIKTVLLKNEIDDGRPILFKKDYGLKNFTTIMGGKIDNIYDIIETMDETKHYIGAKKKGIFNLFS
ncbi:FAD-dependent oxidoreductase [Thermodesulfobacteriota bacterium]